jgi:hypothetical protein
MPWEEGARVRRSRHCSRAAGRRLRVARNSSWPLASWPARPRRTPDRSRAPAPGGWTPGTAPLHTHGRRRCPRGASHRQTSVGAQPGRRELGPPWRGPPVGPAPRISEGGPTSASQRCNLARHIRKLRVLGLLLQRPVISVEASRSHMRRADTGHSSCIHSSAHKEGRRAAVAAQGKRRCRHRTVSVSAKALCSVSSPSPAAR